MARDKKQQDDESFSSPERPDQVILNPDDVTEEIDLLAGGNSSPESELPPPREDLLADPPPPRHAENDADLKVEDEEEGRGRRRGKKRADEDDDSDYSRRVQRRINREIAVRRRTQAALEQERAARKKLEERIARIEQAQKDEQGEASLKELDEKIRQTAAELAKAKEEANTAREVELQIQLGDLQAEKAKLQAKLEIERQERVRAATKDDDDDGINSVRHQGKARSSEWVRANRRWWNTSRWKEAREDAIAHDVTILEEIQDGELNFEPYSDEHFEELARRLKADYPDLEVRTIDGNVFGDDSDDEYDDSGDRMKYDRSNGRMRTARPPMGGLGGRDGRRERSEVEMARHGRVTLTEEDKRIMRIFKLDPNNATHKKYFAQERARTLLNTQNRGVRQ